MKRRQIGRLVARLDAPGLDAGEVEQRVDELQQPQAVAVQRPRSRSRCSAGSGTLGIGEQRPRAGRASGSAACGTRG